MRKFLFAAAATLAALCSAAAHGADVSDATSQPTWLRQGQAMSSASAATQPATQPGAGAGYVPWQKRYGPAYPGDFWRSFGRDAKELPATIWDDTKATATNPWSLAGFVVAAAAGIAINSSGADYEVGQHYLHHGPDLNSEWDSVGDAGGNPGTHFALAGAWYFSSLATGNTRGYENSKTMLNALALNGLVTLGLKLACNTESPNGDDFGWPSGHTSSSFAAATVLAEQYGPVAGIPAFAFATFVGYERVQAANHDLSDVVSGALIGMAIAHAVTQNHEMRIAGAEVVPMVTPSGAVGIALVKRW
jgi:hypothetical protein